MGSNPAIREVVLPLPSIRILLTPEPSRLKLLKPPQRTLGQSTRVTLSARIRYSVVRDRLRPCGKPLREYREGGRLS